MHDDPSVWAYFNHCTQVAFAFILVAPFPVRTSNNSQTNAHVHFTCRRGEGVPTQLLVEPQNSKLGYLGEWKLSFQCPQFGKAKFCLSSSSSETKVRIWLALSQAGKPQTARAWHLHLHEIAPDWCECGPGRSIAHGSLDRGVALLVLKWLGRSIHGGEAPLVPGRQQSSQINEHFLRSALRLARHWYARGASSVQLWKALSSAPRHTATLSMPNCQKWSNPPLL